MEIDHVFLRAKFGAPEADLLNEFGLTEGTGNRHPGQGTANRRFFFHNAFIELLWIADEDEVEAEATLPTMLHKRLSWDCPEVCPFGVCFRSVPGQTLPPFPTWTYAPPYLPGGMSIGVGSGAPLSEPMWFFVKEALAPEAALEGRRQPLRHAAGFREITSIAITMLAISEWSEPALAALNAGQVSLAHGKHYLIEITFDNGSSGRQRDFRPTLPLILNY